MKKKMTKYGKGGSYKPVPAGNKGLGKLPTAVRNKMGYKQMGGSTSADQTYTKLSLKNDGSVKKYKETSKKKFDEKSKKYSNQKGSNTLGSSSSKAQEVVSGKNPNKSVSRRSATMMSMGGEKLLTKMTYGGASMDMSDPLVETMRGKKGKEMKKTPMYKMGGWTHSKKK